MVLKLRLKQINSSSLEWLPMTDENSKLGWPLSDNFRLIKPARESFF